jgi:hypothetical protein
VPLVAREKVVAVLYADSAGQDADAVNLEALETLARVAGMSVELLALRRSSPQTGAAASTTQPQAAQPAPQEAQPQEAQPTSFEPQEAQPSGFEPRESQESHEHRPTEDEAQPSVSGFEPRPVAAEADKGAHALVGEAQVASEPAHAPQAEDSLSPSFAPAVEGSAAGEAVSPLGRSRRYGSMDMDFPVEVAEEDKRFHNEARRFARLLVSEIKLYNEQKVREGRDNSDLYDRLHEDIDRSRQMYDKRVRPEVSSRYDYFHHELVNMLAEGDASRLGVGYPGAQ